MRVNGLFGWVEYNNTRSFVLLLCFVLLMQPLAAIALFLPLLYNDPAHAPLYHWLGYATRYVPVVTLAAAALFVVQMMWHVKTVRKAVAFRFVDNADEPRLCTLVQPLAIAAGVPDPYVGVIDSPALNAFACGITRRSSVIVFTRGIIDGLDDDELASVIAHELMHIPNGDARLIAAANVFLRDMALLDRLSAWKPKRYRHIASVLLLPALFLVYLSVALLSELCLRLGYASRLLISSAREFIADAESVRLTQHPSALVSALKRIQGNSALPGLPVEADAMMFDGRAHGRLATHPAIVDRIQAIVATTGQMALERRPRRDTRAVDGVWSGAFGRRGLAAQHDYAMGRIAATGAAPHTDVLRAFAMVGSDRLILGLRWDLAVIMLATFLTGMTIHRGDIGGVLGEMGHFLDHPDADVGGIMSAVRGCRVSQWKFLIGKRAPSDAKACDKMMDAMTSYAKQFGITLTPDGRMLGPSEMAMLSPEELDGPGYGQSSLRGGFSAGRPGVGAPQPVLTAIDLKPSYPLPLDEVRLRLVQGSIAPFLRSRQCGVLVHSHLSSANDTVTWSITSDTVEQVRFTAKLIADGPKATRVSLVIDDNEKKTPLFDSSKPGAPPDPVAMRPALAPPLRPHFAEAINALLEGRTYDAMRYDPPSAYGPGAGLTAGICASQRNRMVQGEHFSIHDTSGLP
jgi:Zn-dependent protease with chaperone function